MTVLEQVIQLKNQGIADDQIINTLQQQKISPDEINTALSQAEIKSAVTAAPIEQAVQEQETYTPPQAPIAQENYASTQPPIPQEAHLEEQAQYAQAPIQDSYAAQPGGPAESSLGETQNYTPQEEYYPQEGYEQGYAPQEGGYNSNTIMEIAEQVFSEKTKKIENQISELNEFKTINQTKVKNIDERLKKIESMIDKLQITILEKIGSYGNNIEGIKKEMSMMQDSFGKMINPLADKAQTQTSSEKTPTKK